MADTPTKVTTTTDQKPLANVAAQANINSDTNSNSNSPSNMATTIAGRVSPPNDAPPAHSSEENSPPRCTLEELENEVHSDFLALLKGDPNEVVSVPMIYSSERRNYKKLLSKEYKTITQAVHVRKMPRYYYLMHYAKDAEGNYIGTGKPAADAELVFVPGKGTPEELLQQVNKAAFGREPYVINFESALNVIGYMATANT